MDVNSMDVRNELSDDDFKLGIVQRVREQRKSRSLTQKQLGEELGYTEQQIKDLETERTQVDILKIRRLCRHYHIHFLEMFPEEEMTETKDFDLGNITDDYKALSKPSRQMVDRMIKYLLSMEQKAK